MNYTNNKEYNEVLEAYFDDIERESFLNEDFFIPIDEVCYYDTIHEKAHFTIAPKIFQNNDLKKVWRDCKEAEDLLNYNGEPSRSKMLNVAAVALRIINFLTDLTIIIPLQPAGILIALIGNLCIRVLSWGERIGEDSLGLAKAEEVKRSLNRLKNKNKNDKSLIKQIDKQIEKIDKSVADLKEE